MISKKREKVRKFKPDFNTNNIGVFRFYSGLILGIILSYLLDCFFFGFIKLNNFMGTVAKEISSEQVYHSFPYYYPIFWSSLSVSLAFSFTVYLWTSKPVLNNRKQSRLNRMAQANSFFIFGLALFSIFKLIQFYIEFYEVEFKIKEEVGYLLFLVPIYIFLYNWMFISKLYRSKWIVLFSLIFFALYASLLCEIKTYNSIFSL